MTHPAIAQMHAFNKVYPKAKDCYKKMQSWYIKENKNKAVFYPFQMTPILDVGLMLDYQKSAVNPESELGLSVMRKINALYLFGTWRNTLGIYQLDDDIITDSAKSPIPADTPTSIFRNLPEWCVYVDLSASNVDFVADNTQSQRKLHGFWACFDRLEFDNGSHFALNIILDTNNPNDLYIPIALPIADNLTIEQALVNLNQDLMVDGDDIFESMKTLENQKQTLRQVLSFLLWLCVAEPDIMVNGEPISKEQLSQPKFTQNKKTGAFIPPNEPHIYQIGSRLGGEVRHYRQLVNDDKQSHLPSRKRPHIRRGHWHGYWHGTGQTKEFKVKWQPALFVNAS